ncbi:MAG: aminotransferase class III-fold pyridoxal phosphate-dependent enzyme [Chloroflexi bacterium]|nr:aminotransferase class III-fold pyridoxal phosphate-dependent enzyme [Chloroflexota bacterium]
MSPEPVRHSALWHPFTQMARFDAEPRLVVERASGCRLFANDGREYLDGVASLWAIVHGHSEPRIVEATVSHTSRCCSSRCAFRARTGIAARRAARD